MRVGVYVRVKAKPQLELAEAVVDGIRNMREIPFLFYDLGDTWKRCDAVVLFGIGGDAKMIRDASIKSGKRIVLLDKPYIRQVKSNANAPELPRYYLVRISVDDFQPLRYFQRVKRPSDRWDALKVEVSTYSRPELKTGYILFDGASNKYIQWNNLGDGIGEPIEQWARWGQGIVNTISKHTTRPIIYRPRPSHNPAPSVAGALLSEGPLKEDFSGASIVVSHGGNIGYDAVVSGVPHFAFGTSIARPISETDWNRVGRPLIPSEESRRQWLYDLAYCQWSMPEFRTGYAWRYIRETMEVLDGLR